MITSVDEDMVPESIESFASAPSFSDQSIDIGSQHGACVVE